MFSPILAILSVRTSWTLLSKFKYFDFKISSRSPLLFSEILATELTNSWNSTFLATKSVSELTSTIEPKLSSIQIPIKPSEATRPDFLDAVASPFFLNQSTAASISPLVSDKAFLQSIIPALDLILNSLTICAVIDIFYSFGIKRGLFFWFRRFRLWSCF